MRRITVNSNAFLAAGESQKYILLGSESVTTGDLEEKILPKINKLNPEPVPGFWGTLGYKNDKPVNWRGYLEISSSGNKDFTGVVREEVEILHECYPDLNSDEISECFISFDNVEIDFPDLFTEDEIPELRLDVMVSQDEGAVVFYQSEKDDTSECRIEYIQPESTDKKHSYKRDRLKYYFNVIPQYQVEEVPALRGCLRLKDEKENNPFILKVVKFKRTLSSQLQKKGEAVSGRDLLRQIEKQLDKNEPRNRNKKPAVLIFKPDDNDFFKAGKKDIDPDKKTLFLMHGTFANTSKTYKELYGKDKTFLQKLMRHYGGCYEQIIAFNHHTVCDGARENSKILFRLLKTLGISRFTQEVDFIGSSQGGLLIQYLANTEYERLKVGRAVLDASANGVGYFTAAKRVAKFLTILKYTLKAAGMQGKALIAALAQNSAELLLEQPGFQIMTPAHKRLTEIMGGTPLNPNTRYYPIIDDYDKDIFDDSTFRLLKIISFGAADLISRQFLGKYNDLVVGTRNQYLVPAEYCAIPGYNPTNFKGIMRKAIHGTCINLPEVQKDIRKFLKKGNVRSRSVQTIGIDGHCHIFGREIISGRILVLLLEELISYSEKHPEAEKIPSDHFENKVGKTDLRELIGIAKNIIKYFLLNKDSYRMLEDLQSEYMEVNSHIGRFVPLMFDLETSFQNKYHEKDGKKTLKKTENEFQKSIKGYLNKIDKIIDAFEKHNVNPIRGTLEENRESIKTLKFFRTVFKTLKILDSSLISDTASAFDRQIKEMQILKKIYGENLLPFLAVDPRRKNIAEIIKDQVGPGKTFHGIKLYTPNGYSPTDPRLFDDDQHFINGISLYSYCSKHNIPVLAHCSNRGFATFARDIQIWGDIYVKDNPEDDAGRLENNSEPTWKSFNHYLFEGGFSKSVAERAQALNHPLIWDKVLDNYKDLKLCLAHFGGESDEWRNQIVVLMKKHKNLYTDLSCHIDRKRLKRIYEEIMSDQDISDRIFYGSDYFLNMLNDIEFSKYYKNFKGVFKSDFARISRENPERFL
ncbi:MAG: amidohydrolase family protein [Sphaerochaetaceae bacterium]|nr:amidohydrolase family protein [Sphaerochaetaceae bacterium]